MLVEPALLSPRFRDDGRPSHPLSAAAAGLARTLRDDLAAPGAKLNHACCPLCGGGRAWLVAEKDRNGLPSPLVVCQDCGLAFVLSVPTAATAARYYSGFAHLFKTQDATPEQLFERRTRPGAYAWTRAAWVRARLGDEGYARLGVVAEIGCSDGCNLLPYARDGKRTVGCDLDGVRVAQGRAAGLDLREGEFLDELTGQVDLLILSHVAEHMVDVTAFLTRAKALLAPDGIIYAEVPGIGMILPRARWFSVDGYHAANDLLGYLQFEHNYAFDLATLAAFAGKVGLACDHGDEVVRALLKPGGEPAPVPSGRGEQVLARLTEAERDWQRAQFPGKQMVRRLVRALRGARG